MKRRFTSAGLLSLLLLLASFGGYAGHTVHALGFWSGG